MGGPQHIWALHIHISADHDLDLETNSECRIPERVPDSEHCIAQWHYPGILSFHKWWWHNTSGVIELWPCYSNSDMSGMMTNTMISWIILQYHAASFRCIHDTYSEVEEQDYLWPSPYSRFLVKYMIRLAAVRGASAVILQIHYCFELPWWTQNHFSKGKAVSIPASNRLWTTFKNLKLFLIWQTMKGIRSGLRLRCSLWKLETIGWKALLEMCLFYITGRTEKLSCLKRVQFSFTNNNTWQCNSLCVGYLHPDREVKSILTGTSHQPVVVQLFY